MGMYEDHMRVVANRMAKRMRDGESEESIREYLIRGGWTTAEVYAIISTANGMVNKRKIQ